MRSLTQLNTMPRRVIDYLGNPCVKPGTSALFSSMRLNVFCCPKRGVAHWRQLAL